MRTIPHLLFASFLLSGLSTGQSIVWDLDLTSFIQEIEPFVDLDGDGAPDVIVAGGSQEFVYVEARSSRTGSRLASYPAPVGPVVRDLATGTDVDGDGCPDILVGTASGQADTWEGRTLLFSGSSGALISTLSSPRVGDTFARSVAMLGDMDGDGDGEYAVGASLAGPDGQGAVRFYSGLDTTPVLTVRGDHPQQQIGDALQVIGDVDGDGTSDLAVTQYDPKGLLLLSGANGSLIRSFPVQIEGSSVWRLGDAEDWDGDSIADIFVSSRWEADLLGAALCLSGATGEVLWRERGETFGERFGYSMARVGDWDGDGIREAAMGSPYFSSVYGSSRGQVRFFRGGHGEELFRVMGQARPSGFFGSDVLGVGDVTGDGRLDTVAGSFGGKLVLISGDCDRPRTFCRAAPNSAGTTATLEASGSLRLSDNTFTLHASGAIPNAVGLLVYGRWKDEAPFGDGILCTDSAQGLLPFPQPVRTDAQGAVRATLDFTSPPFDIAPGRIRAYRETYFQLLYRDPQSSGTGFNLSDGLRVTFCP